MAAHIGTIRITKERSFTNMLDNPVGRTLLVILNTALSGTVFLLIFLVGGTTTAIYLKYALVSAVGLTAGLTSRRLLRYRTGLLRLMAAISALIVGLIVLNIYSLGFIGIALVSRGTTEPDWESLIQIGLGTFSAWLSLHAWKTSKPEISSTVEPQERRKLRLVPSRVENWLARANLRLGSTSTGSQSSGARRVNFRTSSSSNGNAGRSSLVKRQRRPKVFGWARRHNNQVHLSTVEEHRCPFCLEVVNTNDPRGVEICPVCQTYHHADCWEVTGTCQIPHVHD
jgi:hypothetical protein